jgi:hypothetical protein
MLKIISTAVMLAGLVVPTLAQERKAASSAAPNATGITTTKDRIAKFVAPGVVGDSYIIEDKFGNVGIGTFTPTSPLTVQGMIEITLGGLKFPDGTVQTTAPSFTIVTNSTLTGNGTAASPLGIKVPLSLTGAANVLRVESTGGSQSRAIEAKGGPSSTGFGGAGMLGRGGDTSASSSRGGTGVVGVGGNGGSASGGGRGVEGEGGEASGAGNESGTGIIGFPGEARNGATIGKAGRFLGDVEVLGTVSKSGGSFKIDHPLDPANKYLYHSFVESPDMMNIYNGNITTDGNGMAVVELPEWFEALNRDFRYQLTVVGQFAQAIVAEKVKGNRFTIQTSSPNVEVSWQVTGIRQDAWANDNRIRVEEEKSEKERGLYLHPEAFKQSEEKSVLTVQFPERARELKQRRLNSEPTQNQPN